MAAVDSGDSLRVAVAVDGSKNAKHAFDVAVAITGRRDHVTVVHFADPRKEYLPAEMKPDAIRDFYDTELVGRYPSERYKVVVEARRADVSAKEAICTFVNNSGCDLLVVGMVGRKGPKVEATILGSTADYSMRRAHCSALIVKNDPMPAGTLWVVGVDGSSSSDNGVRIATHFRRPTDRVALVHVKERAYVDVGRAAANSLEAVTKKYSTVAGGDDGVAFEVIERAGDESVAATLVTYTEDRDAGVVVVGADGMGAYASGRRAFGSNSDRVVALARCHVLVTQVKGEVHYC